MLLYSGALLVHKDICNTFALLDNRALFIFVTEMEIFGLKSTTKAIGHFNLNLYKIMFIESMETTVKLMRNKLHFSKLEKMKQQLDGRRKQAETSEDISQYNNLPDDYFGFKSSFYPDPCPELKNLECEFKNILRDIKERHFENDIQKEIKDDKRRINSEENLIIQSDKTGNYWLLSVKEYHKKIMELITKEYRKADIKWVLDMNEEAKVITKQLNIDNRVDALGKQEAFLTIKDHKSEFPNKIECRLINPCKSQIGRISKVIIERWVKELRQKIAPNHIYSTQQAVSWFKNMKNKSDAKFILFDINSFYPNITQELIRKAINFAKQHVYVHENSIKIIEHSRKSLLWYNDQPWVKIKDENCDVAQGQFDGAEISDLVGIYMLSLISGEGKIFRTEDSILYRDDGLGITWGDGHHADSVRKKLHQIFRAEGLTITCECNLKTVNFLDAKFSLTNEKSSPFIKPNGRVEYVPVGSNHPPQVIRNIPKGVEKRLNCLSSDKKCFDSTKNVYQDSIRKAGHMYELKYDQSDIHLHQNVNIVNNIQGQNLNF